MSRSNEAIVHSVDTGWVQVNLDTGDLIGRHGRVLANTPQINGYLAVNIRHPDGKSIMVYQHRVVAYAAFGDVALAADTIDHANRNRSDNRATNLIPKTFSDNAKNRKRKKPVITQDGADAMVQDRLNGLSLTEIANKHFVSTMVVHHVLYKKRAYSSYTHTPVEPSRTYLQSDWTDFWQDVDAGYTHAQLVKKYGLTFSSVARRIERRRV